MSMMQYTHDEATVSADHLPVRFYPERLSDRDLHELAFWSRFAGRGDSPSMMLAAYIDAVCAFESERRRCIEAGHEVLEAVLPLVPCGHWSSVEAAAALCKCYAIREPISGEVREFFDRLFAVLLAECTHRLGLN